MTPVLYSFRRCPYAMRARLSLASAGIRVELREILLRDKASEFLAASPKGTVPVLVADDETVEESFDVMLWALSRQDPEHLLDFPGGGRDLIAENDGPFKSALDRYKYHTRHGSDREGEREKACLFLNRLDAMLADKPWLYGQAPRLPDLAILPFIRQFANTDRAWFDAQNWPALRGWLDRFTASPRFASIMTKYPVWQAGDPVTYFPA